MAERRDLLIDGAGWASGELSGRSSCGKHFAGCCSQTTAPRTIRSRSKPQPSCSRTPPLGSVRRRRGPALAVAGSGTGAVVGPLVAIAYEAMVERHLVAPQGLPGGRLPLGLLRPLEEPVRDLVHDAGLRQSGQGPRLPAAPVASRADPNPLSDGAFVPLCGKNSASGPCRVLARHGLAGRASRRASGLRLCLSRWERISVIATTTPPAVTRRPRPSSRRRTR